MGIAMFFREHESKESLDHAVWIECNYKKLEHGFLETYLNEGLYCSGCRNGFRRKDVEHLTHCPKCGAKMIDDIYKEVT